MKNVKVKVYKAKAAKGQELSIYLDFYPAIMNPYTGRTTRRLFLNIRLVANPQHKEQRAANYEKEVRALNYAYNVESRIRNNDFSFFDTDEKVKTTLESYLKALEVATDENDRVFLSMLMKLNLFLKDKAKQLKRPVNFNHIDTSFCLEFKKRLLEDDDLVQNTASRYFASFKRMLKDAFKQNHLTQNFEDVKNIEYIETERNFLTEDEIKILAKTPIQNDYEVVKRAAMFSIYTGLRACDVKKLIWGDIQHDNENYQLRFRQAKTKAYEYMPIVKQAVQWCGDRRENNHKVFEGFRNDSTDNKYMKIWLALAGIDRNITFHCFRHTFATVLMERGAELYNVSKMLGHRSVRATQIYARITDKAKRRTANLLKDL
jgi:integrase